MLAVVFVLGLTARIAVHAAATPSLGAAATYGVLADTYTNTSVTTTVNGDVGFNVAPTVTPLGTHTNYGSGSPYTTAGANQSTAASALAGEGCTFTWNAAVNLSTDPTHGTVGVYTPGVYCSIGAMAVTGPLTLNGSGTYIFRAVGALDSAAASVVTLTGGASACDVFWTPSAATTLGANSIFVGTVIDTAAITVGADTTWTGRALAYGAAVTTGATDTITVPTCTPPPATLHVIKQVVNNSGGSATVSSFTMHVKLSGTDVTGSPAAGAAAPGTSYSLSAGTYVVSENANAGYGATFSGNCNSSGSVTLAAGADKTCTVTNDDRPASITVIKIVINDDGQTKTVADFPLFVSGTSVVSGASNNFPAPGSYTVSETTDPDYTQTFSGDCDSSGNLTLSPGTDSICTITNDDMGAAAIIPPAAPLNGAVSIPGSPSPPALPADPSDPNIGK